MLITVYCGSGFGDSPAYREAAQALGHALVERGLGLVYGGARVGLMGEIANTVLAGGGKVIGVMPRQMVASREVAHNDLSELRLVDTLHERKALMAELGSAVIALPGGYGTLEEFCEALTWTQLGVHRKPCGLLNIAGFYDNLLAHFDHMTSAGFIQPRHRALLVAERAPGALIDAVLALELPAPPSQADIDRFLKQQGG